MAATSTSSISLQNNAPNSSFLQLPSTKTLDNPNNLRYSFCLPSSKAVFVPLVKSSSTTKYNEVVTDEEMDRIRRLQNGSDVRGVALEGEKGRTVDLTPAAVEAIAESFGEWVINVLENEGREIQENIKVSLGRDPRISGASLSAAAFAGLARAGCSVFDIGLATTPACFMSTILPPFAYDASIMMTASHLPYTRNGLKFFTKRGGLTSPEVEEICDKAARKYANRLAKVSTMLSAPLARVDFMSAYAKHLREIIKERVNHPLHYYTPLQGFQLSQIPYPGGPKAMVPEAPALPNNILFIQNLPNETTPMMLQMLFQQYPGFKEVRMVEAKPGIAFIEYGDEMQSAVAMLNFQGFKIQQNPMSITYAKKGFKIIVNAGNGSGGFFTWDVLDKLGADTTGSLYLNPDGMFPNHIPNPEDKTAMALTRNAVLENSADLGIVFDTDVDRSGVVDNKGNPINGDKLIALMSAIVLREHPGTTIVTDARTSMALTKFITSRGGQHCLYRVGYRNVIDKGVQLNKDGVETHLMMETTGHGALKENYFLDDGAYMVVKIIIEMVRMKLERPGQSIDNLIKDLEEPLESVELRMNVISEPRHVKARAIEAIETFRIYIQEGRLEGWELDSCGDCWVSDGCLVDSNDTPAVVDAYMYRAKVSDQEHGEHGWIHLRQSIHNPNIAVNMQSMVLGGCQSMAKVLRDKFLLASGVDKILDITQINKFAERGLV